MLSLVAMEIRRQGAGQYAGAEKKWVISLNAESLDVGNGGLIRHVHAKKYYKGCGWDNAPVMISYLGTVALQGKHDWASNSR